SQGMSKSLRIGSFRCLFSTASMQMMPHRPCETTCSGRFEANLRPRSREMQSRYPLYTARIERPIADWYSEVLHPFIGHGGLPHRRGRRDFGSPEWRGEPFLVDLPAGWYWCLPISRLRPRFPE